MRAIPIIILLTGCLLLSCDKEEKAPYNPWPVWILLVHAENGLTRTPVESCIRVVWQVSGNSETHTTSCEESYPDIPSFAKAWEPIREPLTIIYRVEADGYLDAGDFSAYFDPALAYTRQGAPGDEDIEDVTMSMYPE